MLLFPPPSLYAHTADVALAPLQQGQFFPFFILTVTGLVTLPLTYTLLRPSTDDDNIAPRIKSDFKPKDAAIIDGLRNADKRRQRRVKRALAALVGWALMAGMAYLITVTQSNEPTIWNPYDVLGIPDVSFCPAPRDYAKQGLVVWRARP